MREIALAAEQLAAELFLQLLDGARERRLRDVTLFGGAGEVQQSGYSQEDLNWCISRWDTKANNIGGEMLQPPRAVKP